MTIIHANVLDWAATYDGPLFHALLCDPPYHLTSINERFSKPTAAPAQFGTDGAFARASKGFMGRDWDGGDIAFRPETWAAFGRLLHPGAFGMAFASTRGFHRMAVAIEDAGFIIHPVIMCWTFGSGFPKATRLDVQIDRAAGDVVTSGATPMARAWGGHRYGGQVLKPALEPVIVFQKPYQGRPVDCITRTGAGALNIDAGRIGSSANDYDHVAGHIQAHNGFDGQAFNMNERHMTPPNPLGRWPSNLVLSHHPACNGSCVQECPVRRLGEQSGESSSAKLNTTQQPRTPHAKGYERERIRIDEGHDDTGTAARYFYNADWMLERLEDADPLIYQAKASTAEREAGLDGFDTGTINDGRLAESDRPYLRNQTERRNPHPTIKPLALARHLASLLLPPAEYGPRRLFVPFAGVASEMIGAMFAGWEDVQGVELEADHIPIAAARLAYWQARKGELSNLDTPIKVKATKVEAGQTDMFARQETPC